MSNIITFLNYRADIFLVNFLLSPASAGVYVIAVQISERLWMPSNAASTVLFPKLSSMNHSPKERFALANKSFVIVSLITGAFSAITAVALYWLLIPIFGSQYEKAFPAFLWLLPGVIVWAGARVQANCIASAGKPEWNMYVAICVVIINIVGNLFLIPRFGMVGAAWATSIAYIFDGVAKFSLAKLTISI